MEFPQFSYTDYIVSNSKFFKSFIVVDEFKQSNTTTVIRAYKTSHSGSLKSSKPKKSIMCIKKMPFICDSYHLNRFEALIKAWKMKLILAYKICLLQDGPVLSLTTVEYGFVDFKTEKLRSLKDYLSSEEGMEKDSITNRTIFCNLLKVTKEIHDLGVPHLSINPEKVWIKNDVIVYLLPFNVHYEDCDDAYSMWYLSPEYLFNSPEYYFNYECDVWSIGCIFYDLFVGNSPLFYCVDHHAKLAIMFELLGFPDINSVPYMNEETHIQLYNSVYMRQCRIGNQPHIYELIQYIHPPIATILLNMLHFNPYDRPCINELCDTGYVSELVQPEDYSEILNSQNRIPTQESCDIHHITSEEFELQNLQKQSENKMYHKNTSDRKIYSHQNNEEIKVSFREDNILNEYNTPCIMGNRRVKDTIIFKQSCSSRSTLLKFYCKANTQTQQIKSKQNAPSIKSDDFHNPLTLSSKNLDLPLTSNPILKSQIDALYKLEQTIEQRISEVDEISSNQSHSLNCVADSKQTLPNVRRSKASTSIMPLEMRIKCRPPQYGVPFNKTTNSVIDSLEFSQDVNELEDHEKSFQFKTEPDTVSLQVTIKSFRNLSFGDDSTELSKYNISCNLRLFTGVSGDKEIQLNCIYHSNGEQIKGSTSSVLPILNREEFINYYKKNRIKLKALINHPQDSDKYDPSQARLVSSDVDIYMMAVNNLDAQEGYYHLLENNSIVGQILLEFKLVDENISNQDQSFDSPSPKYQEAKSDASKELQDAIQRSLSSKNEIESVLNREALSLDPFKRSVLDSVQIPLKKSLYEFDRSKYKNDYEYKRRVMKKNIEVLERSDREELDDSNSNNNQFTNSLVEANDEYEDKENSSFKSFNYNRNFSRNSEHSDSTFVFNKDHIYAIDSKASQTISIDSDEEDEAFIYDKRNEINKITKMLEELNVSLLNKSKSN